MLKKRVQPHVPVIAGGAMLALCMLSLLILPRAWRETIRENAFDLILFSDEYLRRTADDGGDQGVVVIDIDRRSIEALGSWPWPRETMAELVEAIAAEKPEAIALDILFAEPDSRSAAALARRLGSITGRADLGMPDYAGTSGRPPDFKPLNAGEIIELVELLGHWRQRGATGESIAQQAATVNSVRDPMAKGD